MKIRVLIVDDEPLAREKIVNLLENNTSFEIVGEAENGPDALTCIRELKPDLVFLDIQIPELDGFGVLEAIKSREMPQIIFVTAYDQYALRAFDVHAVDYLLKPFDKDRFFDALYRAGEKIKNQTGSDLSLKLEKLIQDVQSGIDYLDRLVVKSGSRIFFVKTDDIDWIEAADNYVTLHSGPKEYLVRDTMTGMEKKLDPKKFIRIHRSTIVNIECIKEIQPYFKNEHVVILKDDRKLTLSRKYRESMRRFF